MGQPGEGSVGGGRGERPLSTLTVSPQRPPFVAVLAEAPDREAGVNLGGTTEKPPSR
ncbi:hypothetical protein [Desulfofundulus sp.]|uniref:hypothetical protein n=1 Tax=Desulfofundulus sp. TaxID=2282750 RepID=UPI003C757B88